MRKLPSQKPSPKGPSPRTKPLVLTLTNYRLPSDNQYRRMHPQVKKRTRNGLVHLLTAAALLSPRSLADRHHVALEFTVPPGTRRYDDDNCWKLLLDALEQAGIISGDSPARLEKSAPIWRTGLFHAIRVTVTALAKKRPPCAVCACPAEFTPPEDAPQICTACAFSLARELLGRTIK